MAAITPSYGPSAIPGCTGGGAAGGTTDFGDLHLQTEEQFACAFNGAVHVGWVFRSIEDDGSETSSSSVVSASLTLVDLVGAVTVNYDPVAAGHTLDFCEAASALSDYEIVCASTDQRPLRYDLTNALLTELDGTAIGDGATAVACSSGSRIEFIGRCDDTLNDGGSVTVPFTRAYSIDQTTGTSTEIGTGWTNQSMQTPYVVVGTELDCHDVGDTVYGVQAHREVVAAGGGAWTSPALTQSVSWVVAAAGGATVPTLTDSDGTVTNLTPGQGEALTAEGYGQVIDPAITITANDYDVTVIYTVLIGQ